MIYFFQEVFNLIIIISFVSINERLFWYIKGVIFQCIDITTPPMGQKKLDWLPSFGDHKMNLETIEIPCLAGVLLRLLGLVEHREDLHAAFVGIYQGFGNRCRGEAVRLHEDMVGRGVHLADHSVRRAAMWREVHGNAGGGEIGSRRYTAQETE